MSKHLGHYLQLLGYKTILILNLYKNTLLHCSILYFFFAWPILYKQKDIHHWPTTRNKQRKTGKIETLMQKILFQFFPL